MLAQFSSSQNTSPSWSEACALFWGCSLLCCLLTCCSFSLALLPLIMISWVLIVASGHYPVLFLRSPNFSLVIGSSHPSCTDWVAPWSLASSWLCCFLQNLPSHPGSCCFCHWLTGYSLEQWVSMVACFDFRDDLATHAGIFSCLCLGGAPDSGVVV